jgi:hypothetical protein
MRQAVEERQADLAAVGVEIVGVANKADNLLWEVRVRSC